MQPVGQFDYAKGVTGVSDPGDGGVALDDIGTTLSVSSTDHDGNTIGALWSVLAAGDALLIQRRTDAETWATFTVTEAPADHGAWFAVPVMVNDTAGTEPGNGDDVMVTAFAAASPTLPDFGMSSDLAVPPSGSPPTGAQLAKWLSITATDADTLALLDGCCTVAKQYELARLSTSRMVEQGFTPPDVLPGPVAQAMLMRAAAIYRRRNSVNGFEGFADLGAVAIRASDPDIERLIDPWRAWAFA